MGQPAGLAPASPWFTATGLDDFALGWHYEFLETKKTPRHAARGQVEGKSG